MSLRIMWKTGQMWKASERVMRTMRKRGICLRIECLGLERVWYGLWSFRGLGRGREMW